MDPIAKLRKDVAVAQANWVELANKAKGGSAEDRAARDEAKVAYQDMKAELEAAEVQATADDEAAKEAAKAAADLRAGTGRKTAPNSGSSAEGHHIGSKVELKGHGFERDPKCGFEDHREFLSVVKANRKSVSDERLRYLAGSNFAAAGSDEHGTYADPIGGFLVPEAISFNVRETSMDMDPISPYVTNIPMEAPVVKFPARVDKNHTTSVSGGLKVYRRSETDTVPSSTMELEQVKLEANSLFGVAYATNELLERSMGSFVAMLQAGFRDEFTSKRIDEKISGTGAGKPEGILNSSCLVSVAKESMQAADTINGTNILKMRERAWRYGSSIWLANHDAYRQLVASHTALTNSDYPLFIHGNGTDVPDTLLGRPIYFTEHVPTVGDQGDLILADWSQYLYGIFKPLRNASSMHVRFLEHEETFKFWIEDAGACWWRSPLTPKNGANTLSPFVVLDARA